MNPSYYIPIFMMVFVVFLILRERKEIVMKKLIKKKHLEGNTHMIELAKKFIGKECIVYTFNSQLTGTVKEVSSSAILIENKNTLEAVNLDFIIRIREYPVKKNGKKKSVVLD